MPSSKRSVGSGRGVHGWWWCRQPGARLWSRLGKTAWSTPPRWENAHTFAAGIRVPQAIGDFLILRAVRQSGGFAAAVEDDAIARAWRHVAKEEGLLLCPEGAATYAAYEQALADGRVRADEQVVLFNCASGLKYPMPEAGTRLKLGTADRLAAANRRQPCGGPSVISLCRSASVGIAVAPRGRVTQLRTGSPRRSQARGAHQDEAEGPGRIQIEPAPRNKFQAQIAVDQPREACRRPRSSRRNGRRRPGPPWRDRLDERAGRVVAAVRSAARQRPR